MQHGKQPQSHTVLKLLAAPQGRVPGSKRAEIFFGGVGGIGSCGELKGRQSLALEKPRLGAERNQARMPPIGVVLG